ncbi:MAG: hypothetical protein WBG71_12385 [Leeuwenhoekiella sp.]
MANTVKTPFEDLFRQTLELNRKYMSQGFKMLGTVTGQQQKGKNPFVFKPEVYGKAFSAVAKMNLEYYNRMMELGLTVVDEMVKDPKVEKPPGAAPAFELQGTGKPGETIQLEFVLENTKSETAHCELVNTSFTDAEGNEATPAISTTFTPQSFSQEPGETTTVSIALEVPEALPINTYDSAVTVVGFEPAFFKITLHVQPEDSQPTDGKTEERSTEKE